MPAVWAGTRRLLQKDHAILWRVAKRFYNGQPGAANSLRTAYYHAMSNYLPPPIKARVVVVLSDECTRKKEFAAQAWRRMSARSTCPASTIPASPAMSASWPRR